MHQIAWYYILMSSIRIVSWNVQGRPTITGYTPYTKILPSLTALSYADIIVLQEFVDAERRLKSLQNQGWYVGTLERTMVNGGGRKNHNALVSKFPIVDINELATGSFESQPCIRAVVKIADGHMLCVYVCHFRIFKSGPRTRLAQLKAICQDAEQYPGPVVIAGDLNTGVPAPGFGRAAVTLWHQISTDELVLPEGFLRSDERVPFARVAADYRFVDAFDIQRPTWSPFKSTALELFKLKLDWFLVRGLTVQSARMHSYVSDHRALEVELELS